MHAKKVVFISFQRTAQAHMQCYIAYSITWDVSFMLLDFWSDSRWVNVRLNQKKKKKVEEKRNTNGSLGGHWFDWFSMISMIISNQLWLRLMKSFWVQLEMGSDVQRMVPNEILWSTSRKTLSWLPRFRGLTELTKWKGKKSKQMEVNWIISWE